MKDFEADSVYTYTTYLENYSLIRRDLEKQQESYNSPNNSDDVELSKISKSRLSSISLAVDM